MDSKILFSIMNIHNDFLDKIMIFITKLGNSGAIFIAVAAVLLLNRKTRKTGLQLTIALIICGIVGNIILKPQVARIRPFIRYDIPLLIPAPKDFSFPSGHTYSAFTTALIIYKSNRKWGIFMFIFAVLMAFSRMYLFVHYPTDILAGIILGLLIAEIVTRINLDKYISLK